MMLRLGSVLAMMLVVLACTETNTRAGFASHAAQGAIRTAEITANSSIGGQPMAENQEFRTRLAAAFKKEFTSAEVVDLRGDIYIIFTIVDYVPGCLPNCDKVRVYRNWSCEIMGFISSSDSDVVDSGLPFNLNGTTYNPWFDPAANCIQEFAKHVRRAA
jgi:hypothetical protein